MTILFGRTQEAIDTPFQPLRTPGYGGLPSPLVSNETQSSIEEVYQRLSANARIVLLSIYNGSLSNNAFLGRDALLPNTPIKLARNIIIEEIAFQNQNVSKNFFLDIYKNGQAIGNLFSTITVNTGGASSGQVFPGLSLSFNQGDFIFYRYRNISGTSPSDSTIELYCRITT